MCKKSIPKKSIQHMDLTTGGSIGKKYALVAFGPS